MIDTKERYYNTIATIEYSDEYEDNMEYFDKAICILKDRLNKEDFSEFNDEEEDILADVFSIIECGE